MNKIFTSSKTDNWTTPDWLYKQLDDEFHFELDAAATVENSKCSLFFSYIDEKRNSLTNDWWDTTGIGIYAVIQCEDCLEYEDISCYEHW